MRPLSVAELLDAAFAAVRRNFGTLVLCTLVVVVPVSVLNTLISAVTFDEAFDFASGTVPAGDEVAPYLAGALAVALLSLLAQTLTTAACLRLLGGDVVGAPASGGASLRYAASRLGPLLWVAILYALALVAGVFMLLVGAIWLGVMFCLATPAVLFEEARGTGALSRSRHLVAGHWWRVFGALLVGYLVAALIQELLRALVTGVLLENSGSELTNAVALTGANVVGLALSLPLASALLAYIYFDLRVRKEGFDRDLLAARMRPPSRFLPPQAPGL